MELFDFTSQLLMGAITQPIIDVAVDVVDAVGLPGVFILMLLESA